MNSIRLNDHKFSWGDTVIIKDSAPVFLHPGEIGSICSVNKLDAEDVVQDPVLMEPTWLYTVEFGDGSSIEISEYYLDPYHE